MPSCHYDLKKAHGSLAPLWHSLGLPSPVGQNPGTGREMVWVRGPWHSLLLPFFPHQALPYVCLLIAMLFFIYAIIGMQVSVDPLAFLEPSLGGPPSLGRRGLGEPSLERQP